MKELTIDDLYIISGGAYTETQCVSGMTGAGAAIGAMAGNAMSSRTNMASNTYSA